MDYCAPQITSSNFNLEIHIHIWADSVRRNLQFGTFYNLLFIWTLNNDNFAVRLQFPDFEKKQKIIQILKLVIILVHNVLIVTLCGPSCSWLWCPLPSCMRLKLCTCLLIISLWTLLCSEYVQRYLYDASLYTYLYHNIPIYRSTMQRVLPKNVMTNGEKNGVNQLMSLPSPVQCTPLCTNTIKILYKLSMNVILIQV